MTSGSPWRWSSGTTMRRRRLECWNVLNSIIPLFPLPHRLHLLNLCQGTGIAPCLWKNPRPPLHHGGGLSGPSVHCCGRVSGAYERRQKPPVSCRGISGAYRGPGWYYIPSAYEWHERSSIPSG